MTKIMRECYRCDRCGFEQGKPFYSPGAIENDWVVGLQWTVHRYGIQPLPFKWVDLCGACNEQVSRVLQGLVIHGQT